MRSSVTLVCSSSAPRQQLEATASRKRTDSGALTGGGENLNASQFYITTGADLDSLDDKHTVFGEVGAMCLDSIMCWLWQARGCLAGVAAQYSSTGELGQVPGLNQPPCVC